MCSSARIRELDVLETEVVERSGAGLDAFSRSNRTSAHRLSQNRQTGIVVKPLAIGEGDQGGSFGVARDSERQRFACAGLCTIAVGSGSPATISSVRQANTG